MLQISFIDYTAQVQIILILLYLCHKLLSGFSLNWIYDVIQLQGFATQQSSKYKKYNNI